MTVDLGGGDGLTGRIVQLVLLVTLLSVAPSILIMATNGWTNWGNAGGAAVRNTLIEVAKRIAADL